MPLAGDSRFALSIRYPDYRLSLIASSGLQAGIPSHAQKILTD